MPTCPCCKHKWTTAKRPKGAVFYQEYVVRYSDGAFLVVGGYAADEKAIRSKADFRRALALSGGRFLDRARLLDVPPITSVEPLDADTASETRLEAQDNRMRTWGGNITDKSLWTQRASWDAQITETAK